MSAAPIFKLHAGDTRKAFLIGRNHDPASSNRAGGDAAGLRADALDSGGEGRINVNGLFVVNMNAIIGNVVKQARQKILCCRQTWCVPTPVNQTERTAHPLLSSDRTEVNTQSLADAAADTLVASKSQ